MMNTVYDIDSKYTAQNGQCQKRKRKTERELKILRSELRKNLMWTRESIKQMRIKYQSEFFMTEQQIYKWWWDQTRKRSKKAVRKQKSYGKDFEMDCEDKNEENGSSVNEEEGEMIVSFQDEFGGYCSRLRIDGNKKKGQCEKNVQDVEMQDDEGGANIDVNLCKLLNIDVDKIALKIAMGEDPWSPENKENMVDRSLKTCHSSLKKSKTGSKSRDSCLNKTDMKHSTANSLTRES